MLVDVQEKPTVSPCGKNAALLSKSNEQQQVPWAKHSINRALSLVQHTFHCFVMNKVQLLRIFL